MATATHDHHGAVRLEVGALDVVVGEWGPDANRAGVTSAHGTIAIPSFLAQVPSGRYKLTGFHQGAEGRCDGEVMVDVGEGALANFAGWAGIGGTVLAAALLGYAARPRPRRTA